MTTTLRRVRPPGLHLRSVVTMGAVGAVAVSGILAGPVRLAAAAKPDFTIGLAPATRTVPKSTSSQAVTYAVTLLPTNGWTGTATLAASGLPAGVTASFSPATVSSSSTGSTLQLTIAASAAAATTTFTVTGTSGKDSRSAQAQLVVTAPPASGYTLSVSPSSTQVGAGASAVFAVTVTRAAGYTAAVALSLIGIPAGSGITASVVPASTTGTSATLTVNTDAVVTADKSYALTLRGQAASLADRTVPLSLDVKTSPGKAFSITGGIPVPMSIGVDQDVTLTLDNPNNQDLGVDNLTVAVDHTSNPACGAGNFVVTQYAGPYPLVVPSNTARSLQQLNFAAAVWPKVRLANLAVDQEVCRAVTVYLTFSGAGRNAQGSNK